jgi:predicted PurR-regulated permease PerM
METSAPQRSPFYLRFGVTVITMAILAAGLHLGRAIFVPIFFAILLATLLLPVVRFLQDKGVGKILSIMLVILVTVTIAGVILYFLSTQIGSFLDDIPTLEKRSKQVLWQVQQWVYEHFNIGFRAQKEVIDETTENMGGTKQIVSTTVLSITSVLSYAVFLPIYTFLILYHKEMIKRFLITIFKDGDENKVRDVLYESQEMSQQYITGLLIELCIVFVLNASGFLLLGLKYAVFLALLGALLNIVPYIGMIIANIICAIITLMSMPDPTYVLYAAAVLAGVQIIDNNILMPLIVGSKVKLNAMAIILGVLVAGAVCGFAGMFLAIPALAVLKIIFERVDHLKPWAMLMGDETTAEEEEKRNPVKRVMSRVRKRKIEKDREAAAK